MHHISSVILSLCLFFSSLHAASSSADAAALIPLIPCNEPIPYDANLSDLELLTRSQQYVSDIATLAHAAKLVREIETARVKEQLCMIPIHLECIVGHPLVATCFFNCSSNLGHFFGKRAKKEPLAEEVNTALVNLFHKCEMTYDAVSQVEKRDWLLKSAGNMPPCLAVNSRDPHVRTKVEHSFVQSVCAAEGKHDVYTTLTFDDLSKDVRLLELLAQNGISLKTVVAINHDYNHFVYPMTRGNAGSSIELALYESLHKKFNYPQRYHGAYHEDASRLLATTYKDFPAPFNQAFASLDAMKSAFVLTLHLYLITRTIDQFKARILKLHPELEHMHIYAGTQKYIADCADPALCADILAGHDAIDIQSTCCITPYWQQAWHNFQNVQTNCLSPTAIACSLRSMTNKHVYMQLHYAATHETDRWDYIDGVWTKASPAIEVSDEAEAK